MNADFQEFKRNTSHTVGELKKDITKLDQKLS